MPEDTVMRLTDRKDSTSGGRPLPDAASRHGGDRPAMTEPAGDDASVAEGLEKYLVHLAHLDMPLAMKIELIAALQAIMQNFVDRAFGDDPVQQVAKQRERLEGKSDADDAVDAPPMVGSSTSTLTETDNNELTGAFRDHAGRGGRRK